MAEILKLSQLKINMANNIIYKWVHLNGKAQETINPEWIAKNYPDTFDAIYKMGLKDASKLSCGHTKEEHMQFSKLTAEEQEIIQHQSGCKCED